MHLNPQEPSRPSTPNSPETVAIKPQKPRRFIVSIWLSLIVSLAFLILLLSGILLWITVKGSARATQELSQHYMNRTADLVELALADFFSPVTSHLLNSREWIQSGVFDPRDMASANGVLLPILKRHPQITSLAAGFEDGFSYRVGAEGENFISRVTGNTPGIVQYWRWDSNTRLLENWQEESTYDPRQRPWYLGAQEAHKRTGVGVETGITWSDPFVLYTSQRPGISASLPVTTPTGEVFIIAFNVLLEKISEFTTGEEPSENGMVFVLWDEEGDVIGYPQHPHYDTAQERQEKFHENQLEMHALEDLHLPPLTVAGRHWVELPMEAKTEAFRFRAPRHRQQAPEEDWWADFRRVQLGPESDVWIGTVVPEEDFLHEYKRQQRHLLTTSVGALVLAFALALVLAQIYSRPLKRLAEQSARITELDLVPGPSVESRLLEPFQLAKTQENMRAALDSFARYVPTEVVRELLRRGEAARLGGRIENLTILFSDIRNFSSISESMSPEELTGHLSEYFESLLNLMQNSGGTIDKMIGDAIMAVWGAPKDDPHHARRAVEGALHCRDFLRGFNARCKKEGRPPLFTGFGLATGRVMVGNIGSPSRLNFTVLGESVNLASRLEGATKIYGTEILVSESVRQEAGEYFHWRWIDQVAVKGTTKPVRIYEPLGPNGQVDDEDLRFAVAYEAAFEAFLSRDFEAARQLLQKLPAARQADRSVQRLIAAAHQYLTDPPEPDWDGVTRFKSK